MARGQRAFTVLLGVLLVGGVVAPIGASQPAAAQSSDGCMYDAVDWFIFSCADSPDTETTSYDGDPAITQTTLHGMAVSEWESEQAIRTVMSNYGEDTETVASIEARHAIATAYQQGNTSTKADEMAREAIADYYAQRQINTIESFEKSMAQFSHIGNVTNHPDLASDFVYTPDPAHSESHISFQGTELTGNNVTRTYTLANGTEHNYTVPTVNATTYDTVSEAETVSTFAYHLDLPRTTVNIDQKHTGYEFDWIRNSQGGEAVLEESVHFNVRNSYYGTNNDPADGLPGQRVHDYGAYRDVMSSWENQSATLTTEYQGMAEDLYAEMDAGNLDPNEVRGAEGMVRYLSGDGDGSEGDLRTAFHYVMGTSNPDLVNTSTMTVHVDGYTDIRWNSSTDSTSREPIPTDPMNGTVEGLLFADGVSSIAAGDTFNTTATDNQTFTVVRDNGTDVSLVEGSLTVESIRDSDGNTVEKTDYQDPQYGTYSADEFVQYLEENEEVRQALLTEDSGGPLAGTGTNGLLGFITGLPGSLLSLNIQQWAVIGGGVVVAAGLVKVFIIDRI